MIIHGISQQCLVYGHKLDHQSQDGVQSQKLWLASMVVALRTHPKEQKDFFWMEGLHVEKNRRNNFFHFEKEDKTQAYTGGLGSEILQQSFLGNGTRIACWYFLTHTKMIRKRTELPL